MHTYLKTFVLAALLFLLSGCLYPKDELAKNQVPNADQLETVQTAVEKYQEETNGLVPIKTKSSNTPIFEKYLVDFSSLLERNLLSGIPGNAYENGGVYQYVIIDPENDAKVKLIDLRMTEAIRKVNVKLEIYRDKHIYPPFGEQIAKDVFNINYKELGLASPPHVKSPYSGNNLPIIMDAEGRLYIDYRSDLNNALQEYHHDYQQGDDIRFILAENTPFVPAYSLPYTIKDGEPAFMEK